VERSIDSLPKKTTPFAVGSWKRLGKMGHGNRGDSRAGKLDFLIEEALKQEGKEAEGCNAPDDRALLECYRSF